MKNLSTISLFIFGVIVTAILTSGLVIYQTKKDNQQVANSQTSGLVQNTINQITASGKNIILSNQEVANHNKQTDCWLIINNKVYDITSYFGSHPGGSGVMAATCGTDATIAYATKDPYAKNSTGGSSHSSTAKNLLNDYYLGDLNQTIGQQKATQINSVVVPVVNKIVNSPTTNSVKDIVKNPVIQPSLNLTLNMQEISKHNNQADCWMLINDKVYNITSFFGSHTGGNGTMITSCCKDATAAYMTKNPSATSRSAKNYTNKYYCSTNNNTWWRK